MGDTGDHFRVIAKGKLTGTVETRNMFAYTVASGTATDAEIATDLEAKVAGMFDNVKSYLSDQWQLYETETQKWYHDESLPAHGYWMTYHVGSQNVVGTDTSDLMAYQAAALLAMKTGVKKVIGRKFLAGIAEDTAADGLFAAGTITYLGAFLTSVLDDVISGFNASLIPGVINKLGLFCPFIGGSVGNIISTMRRRKPGYGI